MAKKNNPVARARGRKPAPVKKPFPVGMAVGSLVLVLLLGSIITYAAKNQGLGDRSSLRYARSQIENLETKDNLSRSHREGALSYPEQDKVPPVGGDHSQVPQSCQVYDKPINNANAIHSLEHGAVWVTYNPSLPKGEVDKLKKLVDNDPSRMLSPYPGLKSPVSAQAWGHQVFAESASDKRIERFVELFTQGPQTLEPGAACQGTTATVSATPAPSTAPSASPRATTSPKAPAPSPTR